MRNRCSTYFHSDNARTTAFLASLLAFIIYVLTADSSVSYWDCPEYVFTASSMQIGHPPGNPFWTLAMRMATIPFPPAYHARVINICSGFLMALSVFFLARIIYRLVKFSLQGKMRKRFGLSDNAIRSSASFAAFFASLSFAVLDSTWFSAVEAEVYAFSTFLTAFTIWLMLRWAEAEGKASRSRHLILIAYVLGLSIGVHQLNLLCIPVLALIFVFRRNPGKRVVLKSWLAILFSFLIVALILLGLMPGSVACAAAMELLCVNSLGLPYFSGVVLYPLFMALAAWVCIRFIPEAPAPLLALSLSIFLFLSGIFTFHSNFPLAFLISIISALLLLKLLSRRAILTSVWMLTMLWTGYSAVALILVRGYAATPVSEGAPADIFSLQRYISREQYGSKPLFYGATPYSKPMREERNNPGSTSPDYSRFVLIKEDPRFVPALPEPHLVSRSRFVSSADSGANKAVVSSGHGYLLSDYKFSRKTTPELDMFFPRITSGSPGMLESYADWSGMTSENMKRVEISTVIDSAGNPAGRLSDSGERIKETSLRPTYLQNLRFFLTYQAGYMYLRYLLWNFAGRQNDIPSTGEIDHGNVITGIEPLDQAMVGNQELMPHSASYGNPGRHTFYAIPFLIGIIGIWFLYSSGRRGKRTLAVVTLFFLMTGLAIVVYLNQNPGEPRERDYAFIGSYMAFCIWVAFGLAAFALNAARWLKSPVKGLPLLIIAGSALFLWLFIENFPDHNRRGRCHTRAFALNTLAGKDRDIIFSYGDNFTFPLWYARETEGAAPGATIVDVSYLATPEYVINLMKQGENGLRLTAEPSDIAYGAYALTKIAADADTIARPLIDILRDLYASKTGQPVLHSSRAIIPGETMADTIILDLRKLATTSGMIPFKSLMLLDIIATNLAQPHPRPLSFLSSVKKEITAPVEGLTKAEAFSDTYAPAMSSSQFINRLLISAQSIDSTAVALSHRKVYTDPVIDDQIRRQRGALVRSIAQLRKLGKEDEARRLLRKLPGLYPDVAPGSYNVADSTFHETLTGAAMLIEEGDSISMRGARTLLDRSKEEAEAWRRYYYSLPAERRSAVSASSRRLITTLPAIDSLLRKTDRYSF